MNTSVISYPSGPFAQQVTIAAGSSSGIRVGTPIVTADGLVGHVSNVGPTPRWSCCSPIPTAACPRVTSRKASPASSATGRATRSSSTASRRPLTIQKGDIIVTQGTVDRRYPDLYPYGIQIGSVLSASTSDIASFYTVQVTPFAQLDSLDAVAALISTKHR